MKRESPTTPQANNAPGESAVKKRSFSRWLSWFFVLAGFFWIGWLIFREGGRLWEHLIAASWQWLSVSLILGTISMLPSAAIFFLLLQEQPNLHLSLRYVTRLMYIGQVIRHLPGRFWGVVYQVNTSRERIPPLTTIKVNVDFTLIFLAFNTIFPTSIVLFYTINHLIAVIFFLVGSLLLGLGLRLDWARQGVAMAQKWLPRRFSNTLANYLSVQNGAYSWRSIGQIWLLLVLSWGCYLFAWQTLAKLFPLLADENMILLCATYSIAWVVGFLSMVTPAGLGVREAVFVFLATTLTTPADMALLSLFVRVWLLVIDFLLFVFVLPLKEGSPSKRDG